MDGKQTAKVFVRDDQSFHEVFVTDDGKPPIPPELKAKWQNTIDLMTQMLAVSAGLVMRIGPHEMRVFIKSSNAGNPYKEDESCPLGLGLYCENVIGSDRVLFVENAEQDCKWCHNPDIRSGLSNYYGRPLHWPDGSFFGTICVLDGHRMQKVEQYSQMIHEFGTAMEKDLEMLCILRGAEKKAQIAESDLQRSQRLYAEAVNKARLLVWEYDPPSRRIKLMDDGYTKNVCAQLGVPMTSEGPETYACFVEEQDREAFLRMFSDMDGGAASAECECRVCLGDPPRRHYEHLSCTAVRDGNGRPFSVHGLGQEVTARRLEETRLREAFSAPNSLGSFRHNLTKNLTSGGQSRFPSVLRQQRAGTVDGYIQTLAETMEGDEVRAAFLADFTREKLLQAFWEGKTQLSFDYPVRHPDKKLIWVRGILNMFQNDATGDIEAVTHAFDITEEKTYELITQLITKNEFEYIGLIYAETGEFEFLTKSAEILYPGEHRKTSYEQCCDYVGRNFVDEEEAAHFKEITSLANITAKLMEKNRYTASYKRTEQDGRVLYKQLNYNWLDKASGSILVVRSDVTASFEHNLRQLRQIEEARLKADRANEAKSVFLSGMSHDLRTPLNGIIGFTNVALKESDADKKQDYLGKIKSSSELLLDLVNDTLELSRIESGKFALEPEAVSCRELADTVITALRPSAELKGLRLEANVSQFPDTVIWVDKLKLQKLFLNLLSNAIKYTPAGGTVIASVSRLVPPQNGCTYRLTIEDTGIGMSQEFLAHLYEPFSQERRPEASSVVGTGLGLAIVKKIVVLMGGSISVKSEPGRGTRFDVELPVKQAANAESGAARAQDAEASLDGKRVLLAEDNEMNTEIALILLKENGVEADCASNGKEALEKFESSEPNSYDAILMDIRMPVMNGYEATQKIRALSRPDAASVPIIAMSADAFEEDFRRAKEIGMNGYVTKPIDPGKLFETLRQLIR